LKTGAVVEGSGPSAAIEDWLAGQERVQVERPQPRSGEDERPGGATSWRQGDLPRRGNTGCPEPSPGSDDSVPVGLRPALAEQDPRGNERSSGGGGQPGLEVS
jgi:hypothetical protein